MMRQLLSILIISLLYGCSSQEKAETADNRKSPRIRKQIQLINPSGNMTLTLGETVDFEIKHREGAQIDSAFLVTDEDTVQLSDNQVKYTHSYSVGKPNLKIIAYSNGEQETVYPSVTYLSPKEPQNLSYQIVQRYPHDEEAYTQGLFFVEDQLYESTGQNGNSSLRKVDFNTGEVGNIINLDNQYFGEGSTFINDKIYLLTWTSQVCFVYNLNFELQTQFNYSTQGWGLTTYGDKLLMSDGSEKIYLINPNDFSILKTIQVYDHKGKVTQLNELEYMNGKLYANIYGEDRIAIIDPVSGIVEGNIDFRGIIDRQTYRGYDYAMNGIAKGPDGRIFVTGKLWPELFEIILLPNSNNPT